MTEDNLHITTHDGDKGDDSGVAAIIRAFIRNPGGALQIIIFIGSMYGIYYAMQSKIDDVRAAQLSNFDHLQAKLDTLTANDADERIKIDNLLARGDNRYAAIITKLSAHDVDIAKLVSGIDFVVDQMRNHEGHDTERPPPHVQIQPLSPVP